MKPMKRSLISKLAFLLILMLVAVVPTIGNAATFTVNSTLDKAGLAANCQSGTGECTLRSAIQAANAVGGTDTIILPAGTYILNLTGAGEQAAATGDLDITAVGGALNIDGPAGAATTIIDGNNTDRIFDTIGAATVTISGVTLRNGNPGAAANGGAINTSGGTNLNLTNVSITDNTSGVEGGAINIAANAASVTTMNTVVIANNSSGAGGDIIANGRDASLTINNGTISGNTETAISNKQGSILSLTNVTVSGNSTAGGGGAIDNLGTATLQNVTVNLNSTTAVGVNNTGGIRNQGGATLNISNTIISNNTPRNCVATVAFLSQGGNLSSDNSCTGLTAAGDLTNTVPQLGPLANNGGALQTHALLTGSPAIDTGTGIGCPDTDARGIIRPMDGTPLDAVAATCDKGAFEFRPQKITVSLPPPFDFGTVTSATTSDHTVTLSNAGDGLLHIGTIAAIDFIAAPFSKAVDNCSGLPLALGASCSFTARFAPTAAGLTSDTFDIPSDDPVTPTVSFSLSGTGTALAVPLISVTDSIAPANDQQVPFGSVLAGASADAAITITNTGTADLVIGTIASANPLAAPFSILNDLCSGKTIAPAATCTLTVRFAPAASGLASDTFDIPSTGLPTVTVSLNGTGGTSTTTPGTVNNPPSNPVLMSPTNGQTGVPTTMTFTWKKSLDPDVDAVTYHVTYSTDQNFTNAQTVNVASAKTAGLLFAGLGSMGGGILLIGFVAGNDSRRSRTTMLGIIALILIGTLFTACGGGGGGSPSPTTTTPPADQVSTTVTGLAANTTYFWKVVADDGKGGLATSETFSFKTQ